MGRTYYEILGVKPKASKATVKQAYYRKASIWHPDKKKDDTPKFANDEMQLINLAYETLRDPEKRSLYDQMLRINPNNQKTSDEFSRESAVAIYEKKFPKHAEVDLDDEFVEVYELVKEEQEEFDRFAKFLISRSSNTKFTQTDFTEILKFITASSLKRTLKEVILRGLLDDLKRQINCLNQDLLLSFVQHATNFVLVCEILSVYQNPNLIKTETLFSSVNSRISENIYLSQDEKEILQKHSMQNLFWKFNPSAFAEIALNTLTEALDLPNAPVNRALPAAVPAVAAPAPASEKKEEPEEEKPIEIKPESIQFGGVIGRGGMGVVHHATWNNQKVAIKSLPLDSALNKETQILFSLHHENIVRVLAFSNDNEVLQHYLVMKYYPHSLDKFVFQAGKWSSPENWRIRCLKETATGLDFLHRKNVLHLDLKPHNILVDENWHVVLSDFGLSRVMQTQQTHQTTVSYQGTAHFTDPILIKSKNTDGKTAYQKTNDIYGFAIVAWCCMAEKIPYEGWDMMQIMFRVVMQNERLEIPKDTPKKLAELIARCWSPEQKQRPDAKEVCDELASIYRNVVGNNKVTGPTLK